MNKDTILKILKERDGMCINEAIDLFNIVKYNIEKAISEEDFDRVNQILMNDLKLEPDYLECFM